MTTKERIKKEFMDKYYEWQDDRANLSDAEYGQKYGYCRDAKVSAFKDNLAAVAYFQKYIYTETWMFQWRERGYEMQELMELVRDGFLSHTQYYNLHKHPDLNRFYISQATAKQIYKEMKR